MIRPATPADAEAIARIYNHYIEETIITFEETPIGGADIVARMGSLTPDRPWFVSEDDGEITGYAYAQQWKPRCSYRDSLEISVYLDHTRTGQGIGSALCLHLIEALRDQGIHILIGGIALPNPISVALHEKLGFEKVAHFTEVGRKFDRWIDVGYWQLILPTDLP